MGTVKIEAKRFGKSVGSVWVMSVHKVTPYNAKSRGDIWLVKRPYVIDTK